MSAVEQLYAADMVEIVLDLPVPPSVNRLWRASADDRRRVYRAPCYKQWLHEADALVIINRQGPRGRIIRGWFELHFAMSDGYPHKGDLDNRLKAALDFLQSREYVANDKHARKITLEWVPPDQAPAGCRVTLRSLHQWTGQYSPSNSSCALPQKKAHSSIRWRSKAAIRAATRCFGRSCGRSLRMSKS